MKPGVTVHMIIKNEDQWVWYALQSVLPYADQILITDTGSTDKSKEILHTLASTKIKLREIITHTAAEMTIERSRQIQETKTDWIWLVDGDEVYPESTAKECVSAIKSSVYEGIVVRRYDLLGDVYHRQSETVGSYHLYGQKGHLVSRLINKKKVRGLTYKGAYPLEGWYDEDGVSAQARDPKHWYITKNRLYHAMYLKRSSLGSNLPMFNRSKYKIETGIKINDLLPEVFSLPRPAIIPDPLYRRGFGYELTAGILTPIKNLKRKFI